jgi:hypothetical protein
MSESETESKSKKPLFGRGTILYHPSFQFQNGGTSPKLLIVLNTPKTNKPYLCCWTTSKQKYGIDREGCRSDKNIYVLNANVDFFQVKTWVQFHDLREFVVTEFLNLHFRDKLLEVKGQLREETIRAILNCIKGSQDVSQYHLSLLD